MNKKNGKKNEKQKSKLSTMLAQKPKVMELLYMAERKVSVKELEEALTGVELEEVHIWPEIGIMEITLKDKEVVDVETMDGFMNDEEDLKFMEEHNIVSVYAITVNETAFEGVRKCVETWASAFGGFLCTDSDDFLPIYQ